MMDEFDVDKAREFLESFADAEPAPRDTMKRAVM